MSEQHRIVMVGDCAWVGETLIRYSPHDFEFHHVKRTRSIYSKTLGVMLAIAASKGDLYHVHYGLQDHLITRLIKRKPTICHLHGSDLRYTAKSLYGWIVRFNLKSANRILVAVPDIVELTKSYRPDAEYIPNPVNLDLFRPSPLRDHDEGTTVLFASALSSVKGALQFAKEYAKYQKDNPTSMLHIIGYGQNQSETINLLKTLNVKFRLFAPVPHGKMPSLYHAADVVVTDLNLGYLHMTSLEAMASYRPVVQYIDEKLYRRMRIPLPPVAGTSSDTTLREMLQKLTEKHVREKICREQEEYIEKNHNPTMISKRVTNIYHEVIEDSRP